MPRQLAKIIADSVSPAGVRLTTMEIVIPRIVLAEFNTHRVFSRNSASSRAIPIKKMLQRVLEDPYIPERWGKNGKGMQDHGELDEDEQVAAELEWLGARDAALESVRALLKIGVHKQTTNRLLEPFMWHTIIVTSTEWGNFFNLRNHPKAHPAIARTAAAMQGVWETSKPNPVAVGDWHLPYVDERDVDLSIEEKVKVSCARCGRVSYLTHDGKRDPQKDIALHDKLLTPGHMSPFEHAATPMHTQSVQDVLKSLSGVVSWDPLDLDVTEHFAGNFRGWVQYRKTIPGEADILGHRRS